MADEEPFDDAFFVMGDTEDFFEDDFNEEDFEEDLALEDEGLEEYDLSGMSSNDTVGLYLKEMARVPLLTNEEEIALAMRLESGDDAARKLKRNPSHTRAAEWQM